MSECTAVSSYQLKCGLQVINKAEGLDHVTVGDGPSCMFVEYWQYTAVSLHTVE